MIMTFFGGSLSFDGVSHTVFFFLWLSTYEICRVVLLQLIYIMRCSNLDLICSTRKHFLQKRKRLSETLKIYPIIWEQIIAIREKEIQFRNVSPKFSIFDDTPAVTTEKKKNYTFSATSPE